MSADAALDRALKASSLTVDGKPFHAVMEISSDETGYSGRVEVWWVSETKYRLVVKSPKFSQEKVVNGAQVSEKDDGDYYPRWLENFVLAILDPVPMQKNFRGLGGDLPFKQQGFVTAPCIVRDDRVGGITDEVTWGRVCFNLSEPRIDFVQAINLFVQFKDYEDFGSKQVARTYIVGARNSEYVTGRLTTLEVLEDSDSPMFTVAKETPASERVATQMVSTLKEESMVESVPKIAWPPVREGKTEGYMIVFARADRTGQVRETRGYNSDNAGLEDFGTEQALKYKFKPLIVNGVAVQMEMPLVLHFKSQVDNPIPILTVEQMKVQMLDCKQNIKAGTQTGLMRVSVDEHGVRTGIGSVPGSPTQKAWTAGPQAFVAAMRSLEGCHTLLISSTASPLTTRVMLK